MPTQKDDWTGRDELKDRIALGVRIKGVLNQSGWKDIEKIVDDFGNEGLQTLVSEEQDEFRHIARAKILIAQELKNRILYCVEDMELAQQQYQEKTGEL